MKTQMLGGILGVIDVESDPSELLTSIELSPRFRFTRARRELGVATWEV